MKTGFSKNGDTWGIQPQQAYTSVLPELILWSASQTVGDKVPGEVTDRDRTMRDLIYSVLAGIVWGDLTEKQQASIAELYRMHHDGDI